MKRIIKCLLILSFSFVCLSCTQEGIATGDIIGKWTPTYVSHSNFDNCTYEITENLLTLTYSNGSVVQVPIVIDREASTITFADGEPHFKSYLKGFEYCFSQHHILPGPRKGQLYLTDDMDYTSVFICLSRM